MDIRFSPHNSHLIDSQNFEKLDPHLHHLQQQTYIFSPPLLDKLPINTPGIYTIGGGRQIGKTTLLKQWMLKLLKMKIKPENILFFTGEIIDDHHSLIRLFQENIPLNETSYVILDEVTYIKDWDKGIKFLSDCGLFRNSIVILTGSDLVLMQEARMRFPGRRGENDQVDFHYYPLSFPEFVKLKYGTPEKDILSQAFQEFMVHGGFLTAINDIAKYGKIHPSTFSTYSDWIRGDCLKRGKKEHHVRDFLIAILKTYGTQITWNSLSDHMTLDHPKTVQDYAELLQSMDSLFIQHALIEHKLAAAPKKAKRLFFTDPFIYHALNQWLEPHHTLEDSLSNTGIASKLVETCVINHIRRFYPTYYIKAEGEVDVVYIKDRTFVPIEIKWTKQIRPNEIKQIKKYPSGVIWARQDSEGVIGNTKIIPLVHALYSFN